MNLKEARKKSGLSLRELADKAKIPFPRISDLENNKKGVNPSIDTLQRLADALGCELIIDFKLKK